MLFIALGLVAGAGYLGYSLLRPLVTSSTDSGDYPGTGTDAVLFTCLLYTSRCV